MSGRHVWVVGSGGREHALTWKLAQSSRIAKITAVPGNDGFSLGWPSPRVEFDRLPARLGEGRSEFERLAALALQQKVDLVVVGPDNALADGIVDVFKAAGISCFGPTQAAAQIESSKAFAKEVMQAARVPTARFTVVRSLADARAFLENEPWGNGWVVKADGLALGKGVVVAQDKTEALAAAERLLSVSGSLVIEERLQGEEISWLAICDGTNAALLEPARDHKRVGEDDTGPNTGGMGAFSPVEGIPPRMAERIRLEVFQPTLAEMKRRGAEFSGVLYAGLMWDRSQDRYWVLEFNARFGDPETQVLMPRIQGDVLDWFEAATSRRLEQMPAQVPMARETAVVVVAAAAGYPESPRKGDEVTGLEALAQEEEGPAVFVAGAQRVGSAWQTAGGRVLGIVGMGPSLADARAEAYSRVSKISFSGMHVRRDIGGAR